jgi:hypothetical protein
VVPFPPGGSIDVILDDVFVPAYRTQRLHDNFELKGAGQALNSSGLYRLPFGQIFVRGISTSALGALQGMLNALMDYGKTRVTRAGAPADRSHSRVNHCSSCPSLHVPITPHHSSTVSSTPQRS